MSWPRCARSRTSCPRASGSARRSDPGSAPGRTSARRRSRSRRRAAPEQRRCRRGNVPSEGGTSFLRPRLPASASIGMMIRKRPTQHREAERGVVPVACCAEIRRRPSRCWRWPSIGVEDLRHRADRILQDARWCPKSGRHHGDAGEDQDREREDQDRSIAICMSYASIFLPRYSGVRPTIRPAMNTARITKIRMPMTCRRRRRRR